MFALSESSTNAVEKSEVSPGVLSNNKIQDAMRTHAFSFIVYVLYNPAYVICLEILV